MATILAAAWGTRGDCQAAASVAAALTRRGHDVRLAAPGFMSREAERLKVDFVALGDDPMAWFAAKPSRRHVDTRRVLPRLLPVFARQVTRQFDTLLPLVAGADVVVGQGLSYAAPSVAEAADVPYHYLSPNVFFFRSAHHPPLSAKRANMPAWVNRWSWGQFALTYNVMFRRRINRRRGELGLAPIDDAASHVFDVSRAIAAFDRELYPPPPDVAEALPTGPVGSFPVPAEGTVLDTATETFLSRRGPVVAVDFGSMPDHAPERTTATIVEAARAAGARLLLSRGWAGLGASVDHTGDAHAVSGVPHSLVFPRVDVVVHHGGVGTAGAAARAGAAQVIVPHAYDQYASGRRLEEAGVAPAPLPRAELTAERLGAVVRAVLDDDGLRERARSLGSVISGRDPLGAAVAEVERSISAA